MCVRPIAHNIYEKQDDVVKIDIYIYLCSADVGEAGGWELHDRLRRARDLLRGIKYEECKAETVCIAALYEWNTLVLDMYRLCNEHGLHS